MTRPAHRPIARAGARAGFTFVEVLVVMAIIAVLVGLGLAVYKLAIEQTPKTKASALLGKVRASIDLWRAKYRFSPPSEFQKLSTVVPTLKLGRPTPANSDNAGIEALVQALFIPGFGHNPDLDGDLCNTDDDRLDKAFASTGDAALHEIKDPWGNPLVYFTDADYAASEKNPPTYLRGDGSSFAPKPWRNEAGAFAQANGYQLFSIGPDGEPNTDDDFKAWE